MVRIYKINSVTEPHLTPFLIPTFWTKSTPLTKGQINRSAVWKERRNGVTMLLLMMIMMAVWCCSGQIAYSSICSIRFSTTTTSPHRRQTARATLTGWHSHGTQYRPMYVPLRHFSLTHDSATSVLPFNIVELQSSSLYFISISLHSCKNYVDKLQREWQR